MLNSALTKNTLGTQISLSDYVSSTSPYTFPSDGYIALKIAPNSTLASVTAYICSATSLSAYIDVSLPKETNGWNNQMIYVKKGMKFYLLSALDGRSFASFTPLE